MCFQYCNQTSYCTFDFLLNKLIIRTQTPLRLGGTITWSHQLSIAFPPKRMLKLREGISTIFLKNINKWEIKSHLHAAGTITPLSHEGAFNRGKHSPAFPSAGCYPTDEDTEKCTASLKQAVDACRFKLGHWPTSPAHTLMALWTSFQLTGAARPPRHLWCGWVLDSLKSCNCPAGKRVLAWPPLPCLFPFHVPLSHWSSAIKPKHNYNKKCDMIPHVWSCPWEIWTPPPFSHQSPGRFTIKGRHT